MISITLAGRGAGKTYELIQWAKEDPKRRIVGTTTTRNEMYMAGIEHQFIYLREAKKTLQGRHDITGVAFDNFGTELSDLLYVHYGVFPEQEVILSMGLPQRPLPAQAARDQAHMEQLVGKAYLDALNIRYTTEEDK